MADHAQPQSVEAHHDVDDSHVASDKEIVRGFGGFDCFHKGDARKQQTNPSCH